MYIFIIGALIGVVIVSGFVLSYFFDRKRETKKCEDQKREFEELLTAAENGDTEAMKELFRGRHSKTKPSAEQTARLASAREQYQNWVNYEAYASVAKERYRMHDSAESPVDALRRFTDFVSQFRCLYEHNQARVSEELQLAAPVDKLLEDWTRSLYDYLARIAGTNRKAFEDLRELIEAVRVRAMHKSGFAPVFNTPEFTLAWPEQWNEWALRHYEIPALHDFVGLQNYADMPIGMLSDMAIKALNSRDPLQLAIVLAYCNASGFARDEIGPMLYYLVVDARESTREQQPSTVEGMGTAE